MIYLRKANLADRDLLFMWANDPVVRSNSFNSTLISYNEHLLWFDRMMANESILQYILMEEVTPIGQIRLSVEDATAEIGYSIAAEHRGKGYGHAILKLAADEIRKNHPEIKKLIAKVKPGNTVSNFLFLNEGYEHEYSCYCMDLQRENG